MCTSRQNTDFCICLNRQEVIPGSSLCVSARGATEETDGFSQQHLAALVKQPGARTHGLFSPLQELSWFLYLRVSWPGRAELAARAPARCQAQLVKLYFSAFHRAGGEKEEGVPRAVLQKSAGGGRVYGPGPPPSRGEMNVLWGWLEDWGICLDSRRRVPRSHKKPQKMLYKLFTLQETK